MHFGSDPPVGLPRRWFGICRFADFGSPVPPSEIPPAAGTSLQYNISAAVPIVSRLLSEGVVVSFCEKHLFLQHCYHTIKTNSNATLFRQNSCFICNLCTKKGEPVCSGSPPSHLDYAVILVMIAALCARVALPRGSSVPSALPLITPDATAQLTASHA